MSQAGEHPGAESVRAFVLYHRDSGGVAQHLSSCGLCGTLALTFRGKPRLNVVDEALYQEKTPLRTGGMGRTFTARDVRIGREVVIKEPAEPSDGSDAGAALRMERRLLRELRILGLMEHPAVVPIFEMGQWSDGTPFFAMRRIKGPTFAERIAACRHFAQRIVLLPQFISITEAIAHAHHHGVVHRDLTPDNMMLGNLGEPYVIDWGIATLLDSCDDQVLDSVELAADGMTKGGVGKDPYAPEEQRRGKPVDKVFDVYSLGVTLHHLLAGERPRRTANGRLEPLPRQCPEELVSIVARATDPDPLRRFPDAGSLAGELRRYQEGKLVEAHRYTLRARLGRWLKNHRAAVAVAAGCLIALAAVLIATRAQQQKAQAQLSAQQAQQHARQAEAERSRAEQRASSANNKRDEAMHKWELASRHSQELTQALQKQQRLSQLEASRLNRAIEDERTAAREAMDLKVTAETARVEAESAAQRAIAAEQVALTQARDAQAARLAAEKRAEDAQVKAHLAEMKALTAQRKTLAALTRAQDAETQLKELLLQLEQELPEEEGDLPIEGVIYGVADGQDSETELAEDVAAPVDSMEGVEPVEEAAEAVEVAPVDPDQPEMAAPIESGR